MIFPHLILDTLNSTTQLPCGTADVDESAEVIIGSFHQKKNRKCI